MKIKVATDFTTAPGPRMICEGQFSGEEFRKTLVFPKVSEAISKKCKLTVDLDGASGYGTSFLEESFGGLIREDGLTLDTIDSVIEFISKDEPALLVEIREYLQEAQAERGAN
ncbi:MAG: STAS-like domain-containing protein [Candidatus Paceibacterota bacterium]